MALVVRRRRDGTVTLEGGAPDEHVFSARFIDRELESGLVEVELRQTVDGEPAVYRLDGFEQIEDPETGEPQPNLTAWRCRRVDGSLFNPDATPTMLNEG